MRKEILEREQKSLELKMRRKTVKTQSCFSAPFPIPPQKIGNLYLDRQEKKGRHITNIMKER